MTEKEWHGRDIGQVDRIGIVDCVWLPYHVLRVRGRGLRLSQSLRAAGDCGTKYQVSIVGTRTGRRAGTNGGTIGTEVAGDGGKKMDKKENKKDQSGKARGESRAVKQDSGKKKLARCALLHTTYYTSTSRSAELEVGATTAAVCKGHQVQYNDKTRKKKRESDGEHKERAKT
ncbi:hypothetical protein BJV78DRAFT_1320354 [Lactifluus subvellereus]|nr:hypothetical protein BJV78DRAFT_1320354 [Lactifluus subvellereus]